MISYAFNNNSSSLAVANKAKELYGLCTIEEKSSIILGNEKMLIDVEEDIIRIILIDDETNIKKLINFILEKKNDKR